MPAESGRCRDLVFHTGPIAARCRLVTDEDARCWMKCWMDSWIGPADGHDQHPAYEGSAKAPYRCCAPCAEMPNSAPIRFHESPARRAAPTASAT